EGGGGGRPTRRGRPDGRPRAASPDPDDDADGDPGARPARARPGGRRGDAEAPCDRRHRGAELLDRLHPALRAPALRGPAPPASAPGSAGGTPMNTRAARLSPIAALVLHLALSPMLLPSPARADARDQKVAEFLSGPGTYLFI